MNNILRSCYCCGTLKPLSAGPTSRLMVWSRSSVSGRLCLTTSPQQHLTVPLDVEVSHITVDFFSLCLLHSFLILLAVPVGTQAATWRSYETCSRERLVKQVATFSLRPLSSSGVLLLAPESPGKAQHEISSLSDDIFTNEGGNQHQSILDS